MMNFSDFQKVKNLEIKVIKIILSADLDLVQILMDFSIMISDWVDSNPLNNSRHHH
jgi:hypothetical protein